MTAPPDSLVSRSRTAVGTRAVRVRRLLRNLQVRVTAAATIAAVALAVVGALVFSVLFRQALRNGTDDALRTIAASTVADLTAQAGTPRLIAVSTDSRSTALQLVGPDATVRQTVTTSESLGSGARGGRSTLADPADVEAGYDGQRVVTAGGARVLITPFARADGTWLLLVASDLDQADDASRDAETAFFVVVPVVVALIAAGAWLLSGAVLRPVETMRRDVSRLRSASRDGPLRDARVHQPDSGDRIEALAVTMNGLLGDLAASADRQRHLVADAGHELRTPLAVLRTELELADRDDRDVAYLRDAVAHARGEVERLSGLAEDLLLLADAEHRVSRDVTRVSLGDLVEASVRSHRGVADSRGIDLVVRLADDTRVHGETGSLRRAIDNLLGNALAVAAARVELRVERSADTLTLSVTDDGPGFPSDFLPHAFERFRRADDARQRTGAGGAGLGLAIVAAVAAAHGGRATAENAGIGARVRVTLPLA